jgi:3-hydroxyisobutyrate dehydrogenase-like beta-hydroxyacid dehydrogenase
MAAPALAAAGLGRDGLPVNLRDGRAEADAIGNRGRIAALLVAASPQDAVRDARVVITMLPTAEAVTSVMPTHGLAAFPRGTVRAQMGIPASLAEVYADHLDWHQIARLVRRGCPPRLDLRIVR